jgi:hypothetical protein
MERDVTNTDRLFEALKIIGITTEPTDTPGLLAWYSAGGEYLGAHSVDGGLVYLKTIMAAADELRAAERAE